MNTTGRSSQLPDAAPPGYLPHRFEASVAHSEEVSVEMHGGVVMTWN